MHVYRVTRIQTAAQTTRHEWEFGWFATTSRAPDPRLARHVTGPYLGWIEQTSRPVRRREIASTVIPLILNLGPRYGISDDRAPQVVRSRGSFIAGLADGCTFVESATESYAIQVNFAPLAFGFSELLIVPGPDGGVTHAEMSFGPEVIMLGSSKPELGWVSPLDLPAVNATVCFGLANPEAVEAHHAHAVGAGATISRPLRETDYGATEYAAKDPEGHEWHFGTYRPTARTPV